MVRVALTKFSQNEHTNIAPRMGNRIWKSKSRRMSSPGRYTPRVTLPFF